MTRPGCFEYVCVCVVRCRVRPSDDAHIVVEAKRSGGGRDGERRPREDPEREGVWGEEDCDGGFPHKDGREGKRKERKTVRRSFR